MLVRLLTLLLLKAKVCVHGLNCVSNKGEYLYSLLPNGQPFAGAHGKVICCILSVGCWLQCTFLSSLLSNTLGWLEVSHKGSVYTMEPAVLQRRPRSPTGCWVSVHALLDTGFAVEPAIGLVT